LLQALSRSPLFIDDSVTDDRQELRRSLWALTRRSKVDFVVVDSLHDGRGRGWFRSSARAVELLAEVAGELDIAVLVLSRGLADDDRASWKQ
jgi:replicative DNA helicase